VARCAHQVDEDPDRDRTHRHKAVDVVESPLARLGVRSEMTSKQRK
jgi:hypothetical protein